MLQRLAYLLSAKNSGRLPGITSGDTYELGNMSRVGFEPTTHGLKVRCSTTELPAHSHWGCLGDIALHFTGYVLPKQAWIRKPKVFTRRALPIMLVPRMPIIVTNDRLLTASRSASHGDHA